MIVNSLYRAYFELYRTTSTEGELLPLSGKAKADFDLLSVKNGVVYSPAYDIREIGTTGTYVFEVVPEEATDYHFEIVLTGDIVNPDFIVDAQAYFTSIDDLALSGNRLITITVQTSGLVPIPGVSVDIYNNAQNVRYTGIPLVTDSNGQAVFSANDGTYKVRMAKVGYTFTVPETLTVSGNTVISYIGATLIEPAAPPAAGAIRVFDFCFMPDGVTPMATVDVKASMNIHELPYDYNGRLHSGKTVAGTYNASTGRVYWDIAPGALCSFFIKNAMDTEIKKRIPMTALGNEIRVEAIP